MSSPHTHPTAPGSTYLKCARSSQGPSPCPLLIHTLARGGHKPPTQYRHTHLFFPVFTEHLLYASHPEDPGVSAIRKHRPCPLYLPHLPAEDSESESCFKSVPAAGLCPGPGAAEQRSRWLAAEVGYTSQQAAGWLWLWELRGTGQSEVDPGPPRHRWPHQYLFC